MHFIHASDEWYLLAEEELPSEASYDGYLQLENGVGMLRLLEAEFYEALESQMGDETVRKIFGSKKLFGTKICDSFDRSYCLFVRYCVYNESRIGDFSGGSNPLYTFLDFS